MNKAYIIFCNDTPKLVMVNKPEKIEERMWELKKTDYDKRRNEMSQGVYNDIYFWHIHEVGCEI